MALINTRIPEFKTEAYQDGKFITVTDKDVIGKWAVFCFYPANFTFVCPTELSDLSDHYKTLKDMGVEVYSVSTDTHFSHKAWADTSDSIKQIKYIMLGDPSGKITRGFDVMIEEDGLALRGTFVVNPEGLIKVVEIHDLGIGRSASDLVRKVQAAQYVAEHGGEVCPAKWTPGAKTLTPGLDLVGKI